MKRGVLKGWLVGIGLAAGCDMPGVERLHAPPQGHGSTPNLSAQQRYSTMVDNAMLAEMSVSDIHFIPNTAQLNSLGARRLERYAVLLAGYGGTPRFDSALEDEEIGEQRMQHVHEFLTAAGLRSEQIEVRRDIPGGTGMKATEAVINVRAARQYAGARPSVPSGWERGSAEPASSGDQ